MRRRILLALVLVMVLASSVALMACNETGINDASVYEALKAEDATLHSDANVRVMSYNVLVEAWANKDKYSLNKKKFTASRAEQVAAMLDHYKPDVIGMQEMCEKWHMNLPARIKDHYSVMFNGLFEYTSMIYNTDTLTLIEKDKVKYSKRDESKMRVAAWGLFERKADQKRFVVMTTHFDFVRHQDNKEAERARQQLQMREYDALADELVAKYNCPIFLTGDFNTYEKATVEGDFNHDWNPANDLYEEFAGYTLYKDANYITYPDYAVEHVSGEHYKWNDAKWDHIFVSDDVKVKRFTILSNQYYKSISDHMPIFVDAAI